MKLPIRNRTDKPLTLFIELQCDERSIPPGGEAIICLEDGLPHSIDIHDQLVVVFDEGFSATVEILSKRELSLDSSLQLVRTWLRRMGAKDDADVIDATIDRLEPGEGNVCARAKVFGAFHHGFRAGIVRATCSGDPAPTWSASDGLEGPYRAGVTAAHLNELARQQDSFGLGGKGPFETDLARSEFEQAMSVVHDMGITHRC